MAQKALSRTETLQELAVSRERYQDKWMEDIRVIVARISDSYQTGITDLKASQEKSADVLRGVLETAVSALKKSVEKHEKRFEQLDKEIVADREHAIKEGGKTRERAYRWIIGIAGTLLLLSFAVIGALLSKILHL